MTGNVRKLAGTGPVKTATNEAIAQYVGLGLEELLQTSTTSVALIHHVQYQE